MWKTALALVAIGVLSSAANAETLRIDFTAPDAKQDMSLIPLGDGKVKQTTMGGRRCIATDRSAGVSFVYIDVPSEFRPTPQVYVTVDYYDQTGRISLDYDAGENEGAYRSSPDAVMQGQTRKWRSGTFVLRRPSFKNRENGGADFRVYGEGLLAVSGITLSTERPTGYAAPEDPSELLAKMKPAVVAPGMTVIQQWQVHEPALDGQLTDEAYSVAEKIGITSFQSYVGWAQLEPEKGKLDFSVYDPVVEGLRRHRVKWLPFIILGPYISTPKWFRAESGVDAVCLEHGETTPIQSIWNPNLRAGVRRYLEIFRAHYEPEVIEALNFGISGNWGESIMPAGGGFDMQGQHTHGGWWCGDKYAKADLQRWTQEKYKTIDALNTAWKTDYKSFEAVEPFIPSQKHSRRANVDLTNWYMQSMTDLAEYWVKTARELYPTLPIYLCTGGAGEPILAADWGAQARVCAKYGAGIRITNQGDNFFDNFSVTRMVSSATRLYGQYYTTEPGGDNVPEAIAGRLFDATAGGARGAYFKYLMDTPDLPNIRGIRFMQNAQYLVPNKPDLKIAALMSNSSIALNHSDLNVFLSRTAKLRDAADFEFIDENMIADGLLARFKALVVLSGDTVEAPTLDAIQAWVKGGGVIFSMSDLSPLRSVEGVAAPWMTSPKVTLASLYTSKPVEGVAVNIGVADDGVLDGAWQGAEGPNAQATGVDENYRWTSGGSRINLPGVKGKKPVLYIRMAAPASVAPKARILVNGIPAAKVPTLTKPKTIEVPIPKQAIGAPTITVTFESPTFVPGPNDSRKLGLQIFSVTLADKSTKPERILPAEKLGNLLSIDTAAALKKVAQRTGDGYTVIWPGGWDSYAQFLASALHTKTTQWGRIAEPLDAAYDDVLASRVGESIYYLNNSAAPVTKRLASGKTVVIPAHEILSLPASQVLGSVD